VKCLNKATKVIISFWERLSLGLFEQLCLELFVGHFCL
jgi:hypothetical protein